MESENQHFIPAEWTGDACSEHWGIASRPNFSFYRHDPIHRNLRGFDCCSLFSDNRILFTCFARRAAVQWSPEEHMRQKITVLLVLVISSMLVGVAIAECAAMTMPCCSQHRPTNCHQICATPTGNISSAGTPQFS